MEHCGNTSQSPVDSGRGSDSTLKQQLRASLSIAEAEEFFSSPDARVVGVDMPGVGHVRRAPETSQEPWCEFCGPRCYRGAAHNARMEDGERYVAQPVPEPLRSFVDEERLDLEITPAGVIGLQQLADARAEVAEAFGEPWRFSVDALDAVRVYDGCGHLVCQISSKSIRESLEWAERICAAVNFCAGLPEFDLAVSKPLAGGFPQLRESGPSIFDAIVKAVRS
jgi:hypothetical protein